MLISFEIDPEKIRCVSHQGEDYLLIGSASYTPMYIKAHTGEVFCIDKNRGLSYVNASIQMLLLFGKLYFEEYITPDLGSIEGELKTIRRLKREFKQLDPRAMEKGRMWEEILWDKENMASGGYPED